MFELAQNRFAFVSVIFLVLKNTFVQTIVFKFTFWFRFRFTKKDIVVRLGEYDFNSNNETQYVDFKVLEIRSHPDYDHATHVNDISIVKLNKPVVYSSFIRPICLPKTNMDVYKQSAVVAGKNIQLSRYRFLLPS